ncbi:hypothetical protein [Haloprofundus salilacus]|uniref:hypothetical protein n=1 Tax=Haloprofundus salilacus TaxID=2876190 RepID=UPI001CCEE70C|nr:hypothetical protein [Haloprofundus salilacus]
MDDEVNAILETDNGFEKAALHVKLSDFFEEEAALSHIDRLICWKLGDLDVLTKIERSSYLGEPIQFDFQNKEIQHGKDTKRTIPILELADSVSS